MTPEEFLKLPTLVRRRHVLMTGINSETLQVLAYPIKRLEETVPPRRIGTLQLPSHRSRDNGPGRAYYRRDDLAQFLGPEYGHNGNRKTESGKLK
jgi:hypothetical protein